MLTRELARSFACLIDARIQRNICKQLVEDPAFTLQGDLDFQEAGRALVHAVVDVFPPNGIAFAMPRSSLDGMNRLVLYLLSVAKMISTMKVVGPDGSSMYTEEYLFFLGVQAIFAKFLGYLDQVQVELLRKPPILLQVRSSVDPYVEVDGDGLVCNLTALSAWGAAMTEEENVRTFQEHIGRFEGAAHLQELRDLMMTVANTQGSRNPEVFLEITSTLLSRRRHPSSMLS